MSNADTHDAGWRTWPNLVTALRLACTPLFVWILFGTTHRALAAWFLGLLGGTDWIDGWLARRLHQTSNIGKIIDPSADRILVMTGLVSVAIAGGVPWWYAGATLVRELLVSVLTVALAALGAARIDVLWWGKVSTFMLMASYPLFLLTSNSHHVALTFWQEWLRRGTWGLGGVGLALAWVVFFSYIPSAKRALVQGRGGRRLN